LISQKNLTEANGMAKAKPNSASTPKQFLYRTDLKSGPSNIPLIITRSISK
jgi:hypothetical protein